MALGPVRGAAATGHSAEASDGVQRSPEVLAGTATAARACAVSKTRASPDSAGPLLAPGRQPSGSPKKATLAPGESAVSGSRGFHCASRPPDRADNAAASTRPVSGMKDSWLAPGRKAASSTTGDSAAAALSTAWGCSMACGSMVPPPPQPASRHADSRPAASGCSALRRRPYAVALMMTQPAAGVSSPDRRRSR